MLALKLHKNRRPNIGAWTFWIPVVDWKAARVQFIYWYSTLDHNDSKMKQMQFLTLAKIPKKHPVCLKPDWASYFGSGPRDLPMCPMVDVERGTVDLCKPLKHSPKERMVSLGDGVVTSSRNLSLGEPPGDC